ncbi:MAG: strawberry notch family protein, partial [Cyclobacteriaceae bacterium]|nr:strawberry notch family protein [Cyclobacteriaceae bacterium]
MNLSHRTSQSMLLQQYSTPAPIGFLAGIFCDPKPGKFLFEPSAGNGLLTIAWKPEQCYVNEIDSVRRANLVSQGYAKVFDQDATIDFDTGKYGSFFGHTNFDAVITNPPFGKLDTAVNYNDFPIRTLEHPMAINALQQLKDDGKAAIIIGGHTTWDRKGRIQAGKNRLFFNYLYHFYHVVDLIHIDGHALYSRMGTAFDTRLILIDGRKATPQGYAPLLRYMYSEPGMHKPVKDYWQLYDRIIQHTENNSDMKLLELEAEALKLELELTGRHGLEGPYMPSSESCIVLDTQVPDSMDFETHQALARITEAIGGSIDDYVVKKLGYKSHIELCKALAAEQVDTVGMAIYNIEEREQAIIIGDQTGIGKGRQAAAMIMYAIKQGYKPIFLTEKANLFSDLYRDMVAIGAGKYVPFIVNVKDAKTAIKDESGKTVYTAPDKGIQDTAF